MRRAAIETANWWAQQVGAPIFNAGSGSPGGADQGLVMAETFGYMIAERNPVTAASAEAFAEALAATVEAGLRPTYSYSLGVDYRPDRALAEAAQAAGVALSRFPWKTVTWTHEQYVTASLGYGARSVLVWASDEWLATQPVCDSQKWDAARQEPGYNGEPFACSRPQYHDGDCRYDRPVELCTECGRRDGWYHNRDERGHMPGFHEFVGAA